MPRSSVTNLVANPVTTFTGARIKLVAFGVFTCDNVAETGRALALQGIGWVVILLPELVVH